MATRLAFCFVMLKIVIAFAETPSTLNETCAGDIGFVLQFNIYQESCPEAEAIIFSWVETAISQDPRMAASLLRLHFHDCFVNASHAFLYAFFSSLSLSLYIYIHTHKHTHTWREKQHFSCGYNGN